MRDNIIALLVFVGLFFGIGEWQGWNIGIAGHTPTLVYKKDAQVRVVRRVRVDNELPFRFKGTLRDGSLIVKGIFKTAANFETNAREGKDKLIFKEEYHKGDKINIEHTLQSGKGVYVIELDYKEATGFFNLDVAKTRQFKE